MHAPADVCPGPWPAASSRVSGDFGGAAKVVNTIAKTVLPLHHRRIKTTIRTARTRETTIIAKFNAQLAWETEHRRLPMGRVTAGVKALLADPAKGTYYVAEVEGTIAGQLLITYEWSDWRNGNFWWIQSVYVAKPFRGQGIFRELFEHVRSLARKRKNICGLRLYMDAGNATARQAYERLGLKHTEYEVFEMDFVMKPHA
jgi:GNAT superfamily N-acetyltransferase